MQHYAVRWTITAAFATALVWLLLSGLAANAQEQGVIVPGMAVTDEVANRRGDEWIVALCAGDVVTISMQSEAFVPLVGIFEPDGEEPLAFAAGTDGAAVLPAFAPQERGSFLIVAAGEGFGARGAYTLAVTTGDDAVQGVLDGILVPGQPFTATVRPLRPAALGLHACAGDVVRIDATSADLEPSFELFPAGEEEPLAASTPVTGGAEVTDLALPDDGDYTLVVFGASRFDQGDVELLLTVAATTTITPAPTATPALGMRCTVGAERLNLRSGPGLEFTPPIGVLERDAELLAVARDPTAAWIQVQVVATGDIGWTSAVAPFVSCDGRVSDLPLGVIPPRPTPLPTSTPRPTPTPTPSPTPQRLALNFVPTDGDDGNDYLRGSAPFNRGRAVALPGFRFDEITDNMVFRDRIVFAVEVFDTRVGLRDGDGIAYVDFSVEDDFGDEVYRNREEFPAYCVFGGGDPNCSALYFANTSRWPGGDRIEDGDYLAVIDIVAENGDVTTWRWRFSIERRGQTIPLPTQAVEPAPGGNGDTARITDIRLADGRYIVAFETSGFLPVLPGRHVHFFWDTVPQSHAGVPGSGPWQLYPPGPGTGLSPFTLFTQNDRPAGATQICILVANADHSVNQGTGNCYPLP